MDIREMHDLSDLAVNAYLGKPSVDGKYSTNDDKEVFRQAIIQLNGGKETFDQFDLERAKTNGIFELITETIQKAVNEGISDDHPIFRFVDRRNLALNESNVFVIEDNGLFVVSKIADGTQQIRRQRFLGGEEVIVKTDVYGVKIYEELRRLASGTTDIVRLIDKVIQSFVVDINTKACEAVVGAFTKIKTPFSDAGTYDEEKLLRIIDSVEAANPGKQVYVMGSKQAVRGIKVSGSDSNSAKEDKYKMGYYGHIATTPVIALTNFFKPGTTELGLSDKDLYVVAADDKFVKHVTEGKTYMFDKDVMDSKALQKEFLMCQRYGFAVVFSSQAGVYKVA